MGRSTGQPADLSEYDLRRGPSLMRANLTALRAEKATFLTFSFCAGCIRTAMTVFTLSYVSVVGLLGAVCAASGEALVIDPSRSIERYIAGADRAGLFLVTSIGRSRRITDRQPVRRRRA